MRLRRRLVPDSLFFRIFFLDNWGYGVNMVLICVWFESSRNSYPRLSEKRSRWKNGKEKSRLSGGRKSGRLTAMGMVMGLLSRN